MKTIFLSTALATVASAAAFLADPAFAATDDPVSALIRQQTDLTSNAGQSGDQATVDRLTSDLVLFSAGDGSVQRDAKFDVTGPLLNKLKSWTEVLHQHPDALKPHMVASNAMFVDEKGAMNSHSDFSAGRASVSEFVLHQTKTVAVSSFSLESAGHRFLSVEIWSEQGKSWRLLAGQTIALHDDPTTIAVPADTLESYAGTYSAGPGSAVAISATADGLTSTPAGGKARILKPEAEDLFFTPGLPAGYLRQPSFFVHDKNGAVTAYRSNGIYFERIDPSKATTGAAPEAGPLKLRDFKVLHVKDVAVAAFFHDRDTSYYGQVLHQTFQSMEAWVNDGGTWKMISSQGCQI